MVRPLYHSEAKSVKNKLEAGREGGDHYEFWSHWGIVVGPIG